MSNDWIDIGRNPYNLRVQENETGLRRVEHTIGWINENKENPSIMFCRKKSSDEELILKSLTNPSIYKSFDNRLSIAYIVWNTPINKKTNLTKEIINKIENSNNLSWLKFKNTVTLSLSENSIKSWAENKGWDYHLMKWDVFLKYPTYTSNRGMQIGIANQIEKRKEVWYEYGLLSNLDSSLWRINSLKRKIYSLNFYDEDNAPQTIEQTNWDIDIANIMSKTASFQGEGIISKKENIKKDDICRLLWCTNKSLKEFGNKKLELWFEWFSKLGKGAVIFDEKNSKERNYFLKLLEKNQTLYQNWIIKDKLNNEERGYVIWINIYPTKNAQKEVYWETFTGKAPEYKDKLIIRDSDSFGRVKYRSLSKNGEPLGMAPQRLEENMYQSLQSLKKEKKDIDKWVAKGLNINTEILKDRLSAEQVDAVALGKKVIETNSGLIIADETGFGKGRILAALALTSLNEGKTVIMFTENKQLFSDFYRDLLAVNGNEKIIPTLLHKKAAIIDSEGEIVTKSLTPKNYIQNLERNNWIKEEVKLIITTYSQINKEESKDKLKKVNWLLNRMGDNAVLLLDESHNAAGDSNVSNNLKKLKNKAKGIIFSSATYAKTEKDLSSYEKALPLEKASYTMLQKALKNDNGDLREALTTAMALEGRFIRREHPPVPPPQPIWLDITPEKENAINSFSNMWQKIFESSEHWEVAQGGKSVVAWSKLGSALSRSIREFNILLKLDDLVNKIEDIVQNKNEKVVVVLETTFEAALKELISNDISIEDISEEDNLEEDNIINNKLNPLNFIPYWRNRWKILLDKISPQEELGEDKSSEIAKEKYLLALKAIDELPEWIVSPLDIIKESLLKRNINSGELSGRNLSLIIEDNQWFTTQRETLDRIELVRNFNKGLLNVMFITRAGCSGISLHAGALFEDQRVRNLIEWDIASNTANRVQFWGRVRRKDQVVEPNFLGLSLNTLSEKRTFSREDKKREKLAAHVGSKQHKKDLNWLSPEGELIVEEWAKERPEIAKRIGVLRPVNDEPIGRVDRALIRSIILKEEEQNALLSRLERGLKLIKDISWKEKEDPLDRLSRVVRKEWFWGDFNATEDNPNGINGTLNMPRINIVERIFSPKEKLNIDVFKDYINKINSSLNYNEKQGEYVLKIWKYIWKKELNYYPELLSLRTKIMNWLNKILPNMKTGNAIQLSNPGSEEKTLGVVLQVDAPLDKSENLEGASYWSLSQVGVEVWIVGDDAPTMIPLLHLFNDSQFIIYDKKANINWFKANPTSQIRTSIEGNQVISAAWGKRWNIGRPMLIKDIDKGLKSIWVLPRNWNWNVLKEIPRDLIDSEHAAEFLKDHHNEELTASLPVGMDITMMVVQGGIRFCFNKKAYEESLETWLAFKQNKALSYAKVLKNNIIERTVSWSNLRTVLYAMESYGIIWRCSPKFLDWYKRTSVNRIALFDKNRKTDRKKNPNNKKSFNKK